MVVGNQKGGNFFNSAVLHRKAKLEEERKKNGIFSNFIHNLNKKDQKKGIIDKILNKKITLPKTSIRGVTGSYLSMHKSGRRNDNFVKALIKSGLITL
jgi:hypothetical protein